jgi:hypothetical protein
MPDTLTAPASSDAAFASDPLVQQLLALTEHAERPYYEVGVLLGRDDFVAEQSYHRGRLARALSCLFGHGTIAGLRLREPRDAVDPSKPRRPNSEREIEIDPGLALDRLGRLIELRNTQCFRIRRWFDWTLANDASALDQAVLGAGASAHILLDIFVQFVVCQHGATPAFATGPFNATDATVPSREHDAFELSWVLRPAAEVNAQAGNLWPAFDAINQQLTALPNGTPAEQTARNQRRAELIGEAIMNGWEPLSPDTQSPTLGPLIEHPRDDWWDRVLLARVTVPVSVGVNHPALAEDRELGIDNLVRPFVYMPGRWQGRARV